MQDVTDFLAPHPPFDALDPADLARVAEAAEVEFHAAGTKIFLQGARPVEHLFVIRQGAVEIVHDDRVLDLLGPGELFGHASMLSGLPTGFAAVAAEDTLVLRIRADVARSLLGRPEGLSYVARSLVEWAETTEGDAREPTPNPGQRPAAELVRTPPVVVDPGMPIRDAARRMTDGGVTCVVVDLGADRGLGIVTDRDLRSRVVAAGLAIDTPVAEVMSAPAFAVGADRLGGEVLLDMLDRGIRHCPVIDPAGRVIGVLTDADLVAVATRSSFHLRRAIARATTLEGLVRVAPDLTATVLALHDARVAAIDIAAIQSVVMDAFMRRVVTLTVGELGGAPAPFAFVALGSVARREAVPSSDIDSALIWYPEREDPELTEAFLALGEKVMSGLVACGFRADPNGAIASRPLFARSREEWQAAANSWLEHPTQEKALILVSLIADGRPAWGVRVGRPVPDVFRDARRNPQLLRLLARFALSHHPPTGFLRGLVVEHSGEQRGRLDLKKGGLVPIVDLARWAGLAAGVQSTSTPARLRAAARAGTLDAQDARQLEEAFELIFGLRLAHQVRQLRAGEAPDDFLDPAELTPMTRRSLKEAFRTVARVQRAISNELSLGLR